MKKILHISCLSYFLFTHQISSADPTELPSTSPASPTDLIMVEDDGNTPLPKKKIRKFNNVAQQTNDLPTSGSIGSATPPPKPNTPAAAKPTTPGVIAPQPIVPATQAPASGGPSQPTQQTTPLPGVPSGAPGTLTPPPPSQPLATQSVAAQPTAQPVAAQSTGPITCSYQLTNPLVSDSELSLWSQYAALKSFDYSFDKLDEQLKNLQYCFTEQGWIGFHDALQQSGNLSTIKSQQLTVSSQISGNPLITKLKDNQWSVNLPLSVVYQNKQEKFIQSLSVTLVITKKTQTELGIVQLIATVKPETGTTT